MPDYVFLVGANGIAAVAVSLIFSLAAGAWVAWRIAS
jgi:hypothetical protein